MKRLRQMINRHDSQESKAHTIIDSKTPLTALGPDELLERAQNMSKAIKGHKQQSSWLIQSRLQEAVKNDGVYIEDSQLSQALVATMEEHKSVVSKEFPTGSFGRLFWEEQSKALNIFRGSVILVSNHDW